MPTFPRVPGLLLLLLLLLPRPAGAQLGLMAELGLRSRYVWRGITRTSRPVLQPSALIAFNPAGWTFTTGVWASYEPFRPEEGDLSDAGAEAGIGEVDYWIEAHTRARAVDVRLGHIWHDPRGGNITVGPGAAVETAELYAAALYLPNRLTGIGVTGYWDYDEVDGAFAAINAFRHVPLVQAGNWVFTFTPRLESGWSIGQAFDNTSGEPGYFVDNGLAYISAMFGLFAREKKWAAYLGGTVQYDRDLATQLNRLGGERSKAKGWLELGVSYTGGTRPGSR